MTATTQLDTAQQILLQLRETFLEELPDRCDDIEDGILALSEDTDGEHFQRLYREVHSLKGSAGTHGVQPISTICHQLEDSLTDAANNASHTPERIDIYLLYLDLIRRCHTLALQSPPTTRKSTRRWKTSAGVAPRIPCPCWWWKTPSTWPICISTR